MASVAELGSREGQSLERKVPEFVIGKSYTRDNIHEALGGGVQSFLPHKDGRIVCACLTRRLNPDVPKVILVGDGPRILESGRMLSRQVSAIPVFIKSAANDWRYYGEYKVERASEERTDIAPWENRAKRSDVRLVIHMRAL